MEPSLILGHCHQDQRGFLRYNNQFDASEIKRMYLIENASSEFNRGWQGHKTEQRWFSAMAGKFAIQLIKVDDWEHPDAKLKPYVFELSSDALHFLHIPPGYISCIRAQSDAARLLVMADYNMAEINDDYRFSLDQFECTKKLK